MTTMFITAHTYLTVFLWKIRNVNLMSSNSVIDCSQNNVLIRKDHILLYKHHILIFAISIETSMERLIEIGKN